MNLQTITNSISLGEKKLEIPCCWFMKFVTGNVRKDFIISVTRKKQTLVYILCLNRTFIIDVLQVYARLTNMHVVLCISACRLVFCVLTCINSIRK